MDRKRAHPELDGWLTAMTIMRGGGESDFGPNSRMFSIYMIIWYIHIHPQWSICCVLTHAFLLEPQFHPVSLLAKFRALGWWIHRLRPVKPFVNHSCLDFDMMEVIRSTRNILPCRTMLDIVIIISHDIAELHVRSVPYVFFLPGWCLSKPDSYSIQHIFQSQSQKILIIFQIWNMTHTHIHNHVFFSIFIHVLERICRMIPSANKKQQYGKPAVWHFWWVVHIYVLWHNLLEGIIAYDFIIPLLTRISIMIMIIDHLRTCMTGI